MKNFLIFLFFLTLHYCSAAAAAAPVMKVFVNGHVLGGGQFDRSATAIVVVDDRILALGSDAKMKALAGPEAQLINLKGNTVVPGLIDSHVHLLDIGMEKSELDLSSARDEADAARLVAKQLNGVPKGEWIKGHGWDQNKWPNGKLPTLESLDKVSPDHPVVLSRIDGHAVWVNSKALKDAGVTTATADPSGGKILRDGIGKPNGVLLDGAQSLISKKVPAPSKPQIEQALAVALNEAAENGLTSVHDMSVTAEALEALKELAKAGKLPIRVAVYLNGKDPKLISEWLQAGPLVGAYENHLTVRGFKLFADGALGSRGAALSKPYDDDPGNSGILISEKEGLVAFSKKALRAGFQVATHAIGDRANRVVLDAYEQAFREYPTFTSPRFRIEHAQILARDDIPRFGRLGVIASMQATHCTSDMAWVVDRIGKERAEVGAYSWQALLKSGAKIADGSDAPVESINPFLGLYAAVTRQDLNGQPPGGWFSKNRMSFKQALQSFTLDAASAAFEENLKGTIEPGKLADFVVIKENMNQLPAAKIPAIKPVMTVVGGKAVYESRMGLMQ